MAESGMANTVVSGVDRKRSGEMWRKVAMKLNPFDRSSLEALVVMSVKEEEVSFGSCCWWWWWERRVVVIMTARSIEAEVKNIPLPIFVC